MRHSRRGLWPRRSRQEAQCGTFRLRCFGVVTCSATLRSISSRTAEERADRSTARTSLRSGRRRAVTAVTDSAACPLGRAPVRFMSASGGRCAPDRGYNVNPAIYASDHSAYQAAAFRWRSAVRSQRRAAWRAVTTSFILRDAICVRCDDTGQRRVLGARVSASQRTVAGSGPANRCWSYRGPASVRDA
jgi:hypothetical protein